MGVSEKEFEEELDDFRVSIETASQYFYAYQAIHFISSKDKSIDNLLNWYPIFWNTSIGALREALFIALGRIFDQNPKTHNIQRLLKIAQDSPDIFKASASRWYKDRDTNEWLDPVVNIYEPLPDDWRRLRKHVNNRRRVYEANYDSIRNKIYAHREQLNSDRKAELFQQTRYIELEKLFAFFDALYNALWKLYYNGRKPIIRYRRYSLVQMLTSKSADRKDLTAGELVALDVQNFFDGHTSRKRTKNI